MSIAKVSIAQLELDFAQCERLGIVYGYGAKARKLTDSPQQLADNPGRIDCSGFIRWALARATNQQLILPDGSQMQREWAERSGLHKVGKYSDCARYMNNNRLFICFIKPFTNGCGAVGHVWLLSQYDDGDNNTVTGTLESHGGAGCNSRPWNYRTLVNEVYSAYELPTMRIA